jgi:hypothetical protein
LRLHQADSNLERKRRTLTILKSQEGQADLIHLETSARWLARHADVAAITLLWRLLESCPGSQLEEEIAGELLVLAPRNKHAADLIDRREETSFPAQRACCLLKRTNAATNEEERLLCWEKLRAEAPEWLLCRGGGSETKTIGAVQRSRETLRRFLAALRKEDRAEVVSCCHLPFWLGGRFPLNDSQELEEFLTQTLTGLKGRAWICQVLEVNHLKNDVEEERAMFKDVPAAEVRMIHVRAGLSGEALEDGYFFVRLLPRPVVLGIADAR